MEEPRPPLFIPPISLLLLNLFTRPSLNGLMETERATQPASAANRHASSDGTAGADGSVEGESRVTRP
jgi:hypothetical protein